MPITLFSLKFLPEPSAATTITKPGAQSKHPWHSEGRCFPESHTGGKGKVGSEPRQRTCYSPPAKVFQIQPIIQSLLRTLLEPRGLTTGNDILQAQHPVHAHATVEKVEEDTHSQRQLHRHRPHDPDTAPPVSAQENRNYVSLQRFIPKYSEQLYF